MLNLWNIYGSLKYKGRWGIIENNKSYYHIQIDRNKLFGNDSKVKCYEFIKRHFEDGKKTAVMDVFFRNDKKNKDNFLESIKPCHTVSLYLLGMSMYEIFENELKEDLKKIMFDLDDWYDFRYTWFLTCFYHDIVSCEEAKKYYMEDLKDKLKYTIYNHVLASDENYKPNFSQEIIDNYWSFREKRDHGIGAGYYFFDALCNNFNKETKGQFIKKDKVTIDGLSWRKEHLDHFAYIADAIICHNIWYAYKKEDIKKYNKFHLDKLIINSEKDRLYLKQSPLYFILCLLDTIEPTKRFEELEVGYVFKNISIEGYGEEKVIRIKWNKELQEKQKNEEMFKKWRNSILELEKWLGVTINKNENVNEIAIMILD